MYKLLSRYNFVYRCIDTDRHLYPHLCVYANLCTCIYFFYINIYIDLST